MSVYVYCVLFPPFIGVISPVGCGAGCGGSDATPPGDMDPKPQHKEVTLSLGGVTHTIYLQSAVKQNGTEWRSHKHITSQGLPPKQVTLVIGQRTHL